MEPIPLEFKMPVEVVDDSCTTTMPEASKNDVPSKRRKSGSGAEVPSKQSKANPRPKTKTQTNSRNTQFGTDAGESDHDHNSRPTKFAPDAQVVVYASQRLSSSVAFTQSFRLIIRDSIISVQWFDRCSAIVSDGIDLVTNLPHLVVLLVNAQHLDEHACVGLALRKRALDFWLAADFTQPGIPSRLRLTLDETEHALDLYPTSHSRDAGPATSSDQHPIVPGASLGFVTNLSRLEEHHNSEARVFVKEYQVTRHGTEDSKRIHGYFPILRASDVHNNEGTEWKVKVSSPKKEHQCRLLHVLSFARMEYIHKLSGEEFMSAFNDCFRCHGHSWLNGIHHQDICPNNLLFTCVGGYVVGVLNDLEMCIVRRDSSSPEYERTDTALFMAYALLRAFGTGDSVAHLYEHDVESFAYVGLWICARYKKGEVTVHGAYWDWTDTIGPDFIAGMKRGCLADPEPATESHTRHFAAIKALTREADFSIARNMYPGVFGPPDTPKAYFERLRGLFDTEIKSMDPEYDAYMQAVERIMDDYRVPYVLGLWRSWQGDGQVN
ncbi:hypothetical protein OE88DRAFT_904856 [Heliocybe sulcata]|uniref:Fungal-type protein kinase domain-containing protein n=1 Tax=Heliocybe sulcata TaxID=5364 RepID=A0A5C3MMR2_9AGAM|nr:hypothetical protein OE88DRAFT_904856 [Heliocybe sulcata]